jgi:hypothetical protein
MYTFVVCTGTTLPSETNSETDKNFIVVCDFQISIHSTLRTLQISIILEYTAQNITKNTNKFNEYNDK